MWQISKGDASFFYTIKLVPPIDLGNIVHLNTKPIIYSNTICSS